MNNRGSLHELNNPSYRSQKTYGIKLKELFTASKAFHDGRSKMSIESPDEA